MAPLCVDQMVDRAKEIFRGRTKIEIDDVVARAMRELTCEGTHAKRQRREDLFDQQVRTLIGKGYPEVAGTDKDQFLGYVNPLRNRVHKAGEVGEGHIPFLIVIPECLVSIPKQMSLVTLEGKTGYTPYLNLTELRNADGVETPNVPYLIFDVENGSAMRDISPDNCVKQFAKQGRHGLTVDEGVALVTHYPETLKDHYVDLTGSRCGSGNVPGLWLYDSRPELNYDRADSTFSYWGSASCGGR